MGSRTLPNLGALRIAAGERSHVRPATTGAVQDWRYELANKALSPYMMLDEWANKLLSKVFNDGWMHRLAEEYPNEKKLRAFQHHYADIVGFAKAAKEKFPLDDDFDEAEADRWVRKNARTFVGLIDETTPGRPDLRPADVDGDATESDDDTDVDEEDPAKRALVSELRRPWDLRPPTPPLPIPPPLAPVPAPAPEPAPAPAPAPLPGSGLRRQPKRRVFTDDPPAPLKPLTEEERRKREDDREDWLRRQRQRVELDRASRAAESEEARLMREIFEKGTRLSEEKARELGLTDW